MNYEWRLILVVVWELEEEEAQKKEKFSKKYIDSEFLKRYNYYKDNEKNIKDFYNIRRLKHRSWKKRKTIRSSLPKDM